MVTRRNVLAPAMLSRRSFVRASLLSFGPILVSACGRLKPVAGESNLSSPGPLAAATPLQQSAQSLTQPSVASSTGANTSASPGLTPGQTPSPAPVHQLAFLDPGHGGVDTGTIGVAQDGTIVEEKVVTLAVAKLTAAMLQASGISVGLYRTDDSLPGSVPADYTADGSELTPNGVLADLQRRINRANASGAEVFLSIHFNTFADPSVAGAETFYDSSRSFAAKNQQFATLVQGNFITTLQGNGYDTPDRGILSDANLFTDSMGTLGNYAHLVVLGPGVPGLLTPTQMPGALCEALFLSNPPEASAAIDPAFQGLIAKGFATAIQQYLATVPKTTH